MFPTIDHDIQPLKTVKPVGYTLKRIPRFGLKKKPLKNKGFPVPVRAEDGAGRALSEIV